MRVFSRSRLGVLALVAFLTGAVFIPSSSVAQPPAPIHTGVPEVPVTRVIQTCLRHFDYAVVIDGIYGPQTTKAVVHFQRANGLYVDGIAGPRTQGAMRAAGCVMNFGTTPPPQPTVVVTPIPTANSPPVAGNCDSFKPLFDKYGLSWSYFRPVMYRESRCNPSAYNGRPPDNSYGLLQINTYGALWGELQWRCGLTSRDQLFNAETNIACAAKLKQAYGLRPWGG